MRALIEEASDEIVADLRQMALAEGSLLQHVSTACFASTSDPRNLVLRWVCIYQSRLGLNCSPSPSMPCRQLSRQLVSLWTENNSQAQDLLKRIFVSPQTYNHTPIAVLELFYYSPTTTTF